MIIHMFIYNVHYILLWDSHVCESCRPLSKCQFQRGIFGYLMVQKSQFASDNFAGGAVLRSSALCLFRLVFEVLSYNVGLFNAMKDRYTCSSKHYTNLVWKAINLLRDMLLVIWHVACAYRIMFIVLKHKTGTSHLYVKLLFIIAMLWNWMYVTSKYSRYDEILTSYYKVEKCYSYF